MHPVTDPVLTDGKSALTGKTVAPFSTYLPEGTDWYDYHTGERLEGGRDFSREYSISEIPVFVRAGAILPLGPDVQYSSEKPWDNLDIVVYPGADGHFTLYEDTGDGYGYEKGEYATTDLVWDDASRTLEIAPRKGAFPGMLSERTFSVRLPAGDPVTVRYDGRKTAVQL